MIEQEFPPGWDADRVKQLADHYERLSEDEQTAEDEQAAGWPGLEPLWAKPRKS